MESSVTGRMSKRMLAVADMVSRSREQDNKTYRVADIGCDHAFVSIYLMQHGIADKVIAMDVNPGPLEAARKNIDRYLGTSEGAEIDIRLSDGFAGLKKGETDAAVVAGMGGKLVISIIEGADVFVPGYKLILSPQSDVPEVRLYLLEHGFKLMDEDMICEDGKYYNIICAEYVGTSQLSADVDEAGIIHKENSDGTSQPVVDVADAVYGENSDATVHTVNIEDERLILIQYGENLINKKNPVFREYLEKRKRSLGTIYDTLSQPCSPLVVTRREEIRKELGEIEFVLRKMSGGIGE